MSLSISSLSAFPLQEFPTVSSKEGSKEPSGDTSLKVQASGGPLGVMEDKADAKLARIKEEIKKMAVLPSSDEIVSKYGITEVQAQQVLAEACMELATEVGTSPEQVTKMANDMYLMAEMFGTEAFETFDATKVLNGALAEEQTDEGKDLSAEEVAQKYDISLNQAQAVLDEIDKDDDSVSSPTASDLSAKPAYSVNGDLAGTCTISLNNTCSFALSTVSYSV